MARKLDLEIATVFAALAEKGPMLAPPARGNWKTLRENSDALLAGMGLVSPIALPVRLTALQALAPTYIDVGDLDIFRLFELRSIKIRVTQHRFGKKKQQARNLKEPQWKHDN